MPIRPGSESIRISSSGSSLTKREGRALILPGQPGSGSQVSEDDPRWDTLGQLTYDPDSCARCHRGVGEGEFRIGGNGGFERGLEKATFITRYMGRPAVVLSVAKKDETDVRHLIARVDGFLEDFAPLVPEGIQVNTTIDSSDFVTPRIAVLLENLAAGMFLVAALLWFTIGFRNAMLTVIAIPFSFLTAIIFFPVLDISINSNANW